MLLKLVKSVAVTVHATGNHWAGLMLKPVGKPPSASALRKRQKKTDFLLEVGSKLINLVLFGYDKFTLLYITAHNQTVSVHAGSVSLGAQLPCTSST